MLTAGVWQDAIKKLAIAQKELMVLIKSDDDITKIIQGHPLELTNMMGSLVGYGFIGFDLSIKKQKKKLQKKLLKTQKQIAKMKPQEHYPQDHVQMETLEKLKAHDQYPTSDNE